MPRRFTASEREGPEPRVDALMHHGRIDAHRKASGKSGVAHLAAPLNPGLIYASFAQIHMRSDQLDMPPEYTALTERMTQQAQQLDLLLTQKTEPTRKRVVAHCITNMQEARDALPRAVHDFVHARIEALNPLTSSADSIKTYEQEATIALRDAVTNAKLRIPIADRVNASTNQIVMAINDSVEALVHDVLRGVQPSTAAQKRR